MKQQVNSNDESVPKSNDKRPARTNGGNDESPPFPRVPTSYDGWMYFLA